MNRGYEGRPIFKTPFHMKDFISLLADAVTLYGIRLIGYCLMSNHYHLILQNSSGRLSEFMKYLNAVWARKYRISEGGKGYLFQGRFKSTLIEENNYLKAALCYVLLNPVRAGLVQDPWKYKYSSIHSYFENFSPVIDKDFVVELFAKKSELNKD